MTTATLVRQVVTIVVAMACCLTATTAMPDDAEEEAPFLQDRFSFWLGGFFPKVDSQIRLDSGGNVPGDTIDFEETLGLEDGKSVWFGGARWRINTRHILEFEVIELNRSGQIDAITEDLDIGDYDVRVGARIDSIFDVTVGRLTYGYNIIENEKNALALKGGLHIAKLETVLELSGNVFIDGQPIDDPVGGVKEIVDFTAPLPHFGASYGYAFTPDFGFRAQGLAFAIKINDYKGTLLDFGFDLQYRLWERFGVGAGFRYFRASIEEKSDSKVRGKFIYEYYGPVVYGVFSF